MDIGLHVAGFDWPEAPSSIAPTLAEVARTAEETGFASVSVMDHLFQMEFPGVDPETDPMLEGYTTLGFLAGATERVQLGLLVTGVTYRHPGILAKIVTTLDVLTQGRAQLGVGAAWYEREHAGLGIPFPSVAERFERLEETIQICLQMWSDDVGPYEGTHYRLAETLNIPQSITRPHPPILIGGSGEKKTLRLVAVYADACNLFVSTPEEARHKLDVLRRHCDDAGTDFDRIAKTVLYTGDALAAGEPDRFVEEMAGLGRAGIDGVMVMTQGTDPVGFVADVAAVVPALGDL